MKIHLEKSHFIFVTRIMLFEVSAIFVFYVCGRFNIFFASSFASMYLPRCSRRAFAENHFVVQSYHTNHAHTDIRAYFSLSMAVVRIDEKM